MIMRSLVLLVLGVAAVAAIPTSQERIVGGSPATIAQYPTLAALLSTNNYATWWQSCGGVIINQRSVLTAAHCVAGDAANRWRVRVGSAYANSGGVVHTAQSIILHPQYNTGIRLNNDIGLLRLATTIAYVNNAVQPANIAGRGYWVADNQAVWTAGWGATAVNGTLSETLNHVQTWTINQGNCINRYREIGYTVNQNMICTGWLDVGGRDQCYGDDGGPVYHNNVVVGITSWAEQCALARYPRVNARISMYTNWIQSNA